MKLFKTACSCCLPVFFLVTAAYAHAQAFELASTGSTYPAGVDPNNGNRLTVAHVISKNVSKGKKSLEGSTAVVHSQLIPEVIDTCEINSTFQGVLYKYAESAVVSVQSNGDIIPAVLDQNQTSTLCVTPEGFVEVTTHRVFEFGTGNFSNACGYIDAVIQGRLISNYLTALSGTQTGEIYLDPADAPPSTNGCP